MKLGSASVAQQNAAFNVVYPELLAMAKQLTENLSIPFVNVQAIVEQNLQSTASRAKIVKLIDDALNAAEGVP